jgi:branched-chain amino acid transport system permease protein
MNVLQDAFTALSVGSVYGVVGAGYVIVHRITGMVNFAQGDLAMAGAFGAVVAAHGLPTGAAMASGAVVGAIVGLLLYVLAIHPLRNQGLLVQTIATLGAAIVLRSLAQLVFGTEPYSLDALTGGPPVRVAGASMPQQVLWLVGIMVLLYIVLNAFFDRTMVGRAMSACAINRYAAGVVGINVVAMAALAFTISGAITGLIGAAQVPLGFATSSFGLTLGLKGFIAAILGGFDKIGLAMVGGIVVGFVESLAASSVSTSYQEVLVFGLLLVLLVARPAGLTKVRVSQRV